MPKKYQPFVDNSDETPEEEKRNSRDLKREMEEKARAAAYYSKIIAAEDSKKKLPAGSLDQELARIQKEKEKQYFTPGSENKAERKQAAWEQKNASKTELQEMRREMGQSLKEREELMRGGHAKSSSADTQNQRAGFLKKQ